MRIRLVRFAGPRDARKNRTHAVRFFFARNWERIARYPYFCGGNAS